MSVFPPGAKAGTAVDVTITGSDLDEASALVFSRARYDWDAREGSSAAGSG